MRHHGSIVVTVDQNAQLSGPDFPESELERVQRKRAANYAASGTAEEQVDHFNDLVGIVVDFSAVSFVGYVVAFTATERSDHGNQPNYLPGPGIGEGHHGIAGVLHPSQAGLQMVRRTPQTKGSPEHL